MYRRLTTLGIVVALLVVSVVFAGRVEATQALTDAQAEKIVSNCTTIKTSMNQLHASDALLRVNRGQVYLSMANNLMDNFNSRLSANSLDNRAMTTVTSHYRSAFKTFYDDYILYEQKLSDALRMDCTADPKKFYDTVLEARDLRFKVHEDVQKLHRSIDDYRTSVGDFMLTFERISR